MSHVVNHAIDGRREALEQMVGLLRNGIKYRQDIVGRTGDELQYFGRRCLLLRASFRSLPGSETERRLSRLAVGGMRRLALAVLPPSAGLASRAFASLFLLPVLDGRAISVPR